MKETESEKLNREWKASKKEIRKLLGNEGKTYRIKRKREELIILD